MDIRAKQRAVVEALEDVKGRDIIVYNTARMPSMFERVVIASGDSNPVSYTHLTLPTIYSV